MAKARCWERLEPSRHEAAGRTGRTRSTAGSTIRRNVTELDQMRLQRLIGNRATVDALAHGDGSGFVRLQRSAGNRAVLRDLARASSDYHPPDGGDEDPR